jgi:hypothetical protein
MRNLKEDWKRYTESDKEIFFRGFFIGFGLMSFFTGTYIVLRLIIL